MEKYSRGYLAKRRREIDCTEWIDILYGLKAAGAEKEDMIIELCAGEGLLLEFLRRRGYRNLCGCDLVASPEKKVYRCDLNEQDPPSNGKYYIFQHCIEHLDQNRVAELFRKILHQWRARAIVGIVPGHYTLDPTHIVNHYTYSDLLELVDKVKPRYWKIRYDMKSFIDPYSSDFLIIFSNKPIKRTTYPLWFLPLVAVVRVIDRWFLSSY